MAKLPISTFLLFSKRAYAVAAENVRVQTAAAAARNAVDSSSMVDRGAPAAAGKKEVFWMRDPNTGNWIPENHFHEVNVAELRDKFLPKKTK